MYRLFYAFSIFLFSFSTSFAQEAHLPIAKIADLMTEPSWTNLHIFLQSNGWTLADSKNNEFGIKIVKYELEDPELTRNFGYQLSIEVKENKPKKVIYRSNDKDDYFLIGQSLNEIKFQVIDSEIIDDRIIITYERDSLMLSSVELISSEKIQEDQRLYTIELSGKSANGSGNNTNNPALALSTADVNGLSKKQNFYAGTSILRDVYYTNATGDLEGPYISYYENGESVKESGEYKAGKEQGDFKLFNKRGNTVLACTMKNGKRSGEYTVYHPNGNLKLTGNYKDGIPNGKFTLYDSYGEEISSFNATNGIIKDRLTHADENNEFIEPGNEVAAGEHQGSQETRNGVLVIQYNSKSVTSGLDFVEQPMVGFDSEIPEVSITWNGAFKAQYLNKNNAVIGESSGAFKNGKANGTWKYNLVNSSGKSEISSCDYKLGVKHGKMKRSYNDSLISASYSNDLLNGLKTKFAYKQDASGKRTLVKEYEQEYVSGKKQGLFSKYDKTGFKFEKGQYANDLKTGTWSYHFPKEPADNGSSFPWAGEFQKTIEYAQGQKNGKEIIFFKIVHNKVPCADIPNYRGREDTCLVPKFIRCEEVFTFENDELNGNYYYKNEKNETVESGEYRNGLKSGIWEERVAFEKRLKNSSKTAYDAFKGTYQNNLKHGEWIRYIEDTEDKRSSLRYANGKLNGKCTRYRGDGKPGDYYFYDQGELVSIEVLNKSDRRECKYDFLNITATYIDCNVTNFFSKGYDVTTFRIEYNDSTFIREGKIDRELFHSEFSLWNKKNDRNPHLYPNGEYKKYNDNGDKIEEGELRAEGKVGVWKVYYPEQNIYISVDYNTTDLIENYLLINEERAYSGEFIYQDEHSNSYEVRDIKNGKRNGKTTQYIKTLSGDEEKGWTIKYKDGIAQD